MTSFLLDEVYPTDAARLLREKYGYEAVHVSEIGLRATDDGDIAPVARAERRAMVTENVADFATECDLVLVFVLKRHLPAGGGQAAALTALLDSWSTAHPGPISVITGPSDGARQPASASGGWVGWGR